MSRSFAQGITEKKRLKEQFRQARKMEAADTVDGGVSHGFNNILTASMGPGNLIQMTIDKDDVLTNIHSAHIS